jgi:hypothetical protein
MKRYKKIIKERIERGLYFVSHNRNDLKKFMKLLNMSNYYYEEDFRNNRLFFPEVDVNTLEIKLTKRFVDKFGIEGWFEKA